MKSRFLLPQLGIIVMLLFATALFGESFVNIHNSHSQLAVSETSRMAAGSTPGGYYVFSSGETYLRDASLIIGTGPDNLSWSIYNGAGGMPTVDNDFGYLLPIQAIQIDSTTYSNYQYAWGKGTNRDSTIEFLAQYLAPTGNDSDFVLAIYTIYPGINATGTISNLCVAFAADWDVPLNGGGDDEQSILPDWPALAVGSIGQTATELNFGTTSGYIDGWMRGNCGDFAGGTNISDASYVDPWNTFQSDSIWTLIQSLPFRQLTDSGVGAGDVTSFMSLLRNRTLSLTDTLKCAVLLTRGSGVLTPTLISATLADATDFLCSQGFIFAGSEFQFKPCYDCFFCGDADCSGNWSIGDAVYIINYIFAGGPPPCFPCKGDANGDCTTTIGDAVYLINYIFAGGPVPGMCY